MTLFCPIVGLEVKTQDDWHGRRIGDDFTANFYIVGQSVLYSGPSGTADLQSAGAVLELSGEVARKVAGGTGGYVQIEDYAALDRATIEARKYFIEQMISRERIQALIFCNLSPMLQMFIKFGQRFNTTEKPVYAVRDYKEAIDTALRLCYEHDLEAGRFVFEKQATYRNDHSTLVPCELFADSQWNVRTDNYTNRTAVIDRCILHSISIGRFREAHVPLIDDRRRRIWENLSLGDSIDYFVVDASAVEKGSRKARQLYMKSLKDWHARFPFRMYILYGANAFLKTAVLLASALMPFKTILARDIDHAFELIRKDTDSKTGEKPAPRLDPIQAYVQELLAYIGGIDWEREGFADLSGTVDPRHPFFEIFQAIRLIKNELDDLFRTRRKIRERLEESENKYRELFEKGSDLLCTHDLDGNLIDTNIAFKKGYGWDRKLPPGTNIRDLIPERYRHGFDDYLHRIKREGHDEGTMAITTGTGREIVLEYNNVLVKDSTGAPIFIQGSARDISGRIEAERERRNLQEQLGQKHKMEAIGTLAGGIAHEFNNILGIILGNAELAIFDIPRWNPTHEYLSEIIGATLRGKDVVKQLLSFSRRNTLRRQAVEMAKIIKESTGFLRASIPASIQFRESITETCRPVMADQTQIHQLMINLCNNAAQAMEDSCGILGITLENVTVAERKMYQDQTLEPGEYVRLAVSDTGHGIADDALALVFDPFYTTKEVDKGSGMGLAVVYGIIKDHHGFIHIESKFGEGTTVSCYFPATDSAPIDATKTVQVLPSGNETILFVDDEASLVQMGRQRLANLGYSVKTETDPLKALAHFKTDPGKYDLVITDMTMPQMTGDQFIKKLIKIKSDVKTILCTGYSKKINEEKAVQLGAGGYLMKPIDRETLAQKVRKVLDAPKGTSQSG